MDNNYYTYTGLDDFVRVLDSRLEKATVPNPGLVAKKVRKVAHQLMHQFGQYVLSCEEVSSKPCMYNTRMCVLQLLRLLALKPVARNWINLPTLVSYVYYSRLSFYPVASNYAEADD